MKRLCILFAILISPLMATNPAFGDVTLDIVPSSQTVKVGQQVVVYLHVSGLTPATVDPAVGLFDIDVVFSDANQTLEFKSAVIGPQLGDPSDPNETIIRVEEFEQFVALREESLLAPDQLDALQGRAVTLVALRFKAANMGTVVIDGDLFALSDQFGQDLIGVFGPIGRGFVTVVKGKKDLPPSFP